MLTSHNVSTWNVSDKPPPPPQPPASPAKPPPANTPSPYPSTPTTNESLYVGYDETSDADRADREVCVHNAFVDHGSWAAVMQATISNIEDPASKVFDRWFPGTAGSIDARTYVKGVFSQISDPTNSVPRPFVRSSVNVNQDWLGFCEVDVNAYSIPSTLRFHICLRELQQPTLPWNRKCEDLGDNVSSRMATLANGCTGVNQVMTGRTAKVGQI